MRNFAVNSRSIKKHRSVFFVFDSSCWGGVSLEYIKVKNIFMSHEGVPQEEVSQESSEAFVPAKEQEQFNKFVETAEQQRKREGELTVEVEAGIKDLGLKKYFSSGTSNPEDYSIGLGSQPVSRSQADSFDSLSGLRRDARYEGNHAYARSRLIVTNELIAGGADSDGYGGNKKVTATPEQIEIARKEMEDRVGS
jgi:hypothetical protein